jgi:trans-aconitate methyltransferase
VTDWIDFYDRHARQYDRPVHQRFYRRVAAALIREIPLETEVGSILEIGAGTGFATFELRKRYPRARIIGLEPSEKMLSRAMAKNISGVDWLCGRLRDLKAWRFDLIFSSMAYHWLDESERESLMALAKDKTLAIALPITDPQTYSNGNLSLRRLLYRLKARPEWQKDARGTERALNSLRTEFDAVSAHRSDLREEFADAEQMAEALCERGVLAALFGDRAAEARDRLPAECALADRSLFNWSIILITAKNSDGEPRP